MFHPIRAGTRGGQGLFKWDDVKEDKHRENYLGHSVMAPVGRWQKNKDLGWYGKDGKESNEASEAEQIKNEIDELKQKEEEAMAELLGYRGPKRKLKSDTISKEELVGVLKGNVNNGAGENEMINHGGLGFGKSVLEEANMKSDTTIETIPGQNTQSENHTSLSKVQPSQVLEKEKHKKEKKSKKEKKVKKLKKHHGERRGHRDDDSDGGGSGIRSRSNLRSPQPPRSHSHDKGYERELKYDKNVRESERDYGRDKSDIRDERNFRESHRDDRRERSDNRDERNVRDSHQDQRDRSENKDNRRDHNSNYERRDYKDKSRSRSPKRLERNRY